MLQSTDGVKDNTELSALLEKSTAEIKTYICGLTQKLDKILVNKEAKEKQRLDMLLDMISAQLSINTARLFEAVILKELRGPLFAKIEKLLVPRVESKLCEITESVAGLGGSIAQRLFEQRQTQQVIESSIRSGVVEALVPSVERGINEMRLQILDHFKTVNFAEKLEQIKEAVERLGEPGHSEEELENFTLTDLADALRTDGEEMEYEEEEHEKKETRKGKKEELRHLLKEDPVASFIYVLDSTSPSLLRAFLEVLEEIPVDPPLPNKVLIAFVYQVITITGSEWKESTPLAHKSLGLLAHALAQLHCGLFTPTEEKELKNAALLFERAVPLRRAMNRQMEAAIENIENLFKIQEEYIDGLRNIDRLKKR